MRPRWLDRRIAAPGPHLTLVLSRAELDAATHHLGAGKVDWPEGNQGRVWTFEGSQGLACVVALRDYQNRLPIEIAGLLVHEAVHVWQAYCDDIGEHSPGREQEAYAIQSIAQELMAEYARRVS